MAAVVYVEGPSGKRVWLHVLRLKRLHSVPVRAGHGAFQGQALLSRWDRLVALANSEKVILLLDSNKRAEAQQILSTASSVPGKAVAFLTTPWRGIEEFTESHLDERDLADYQAACGNRLHKKVLAELFADKLSLTKVDADEWIASVLVSCLDCQCPPGTTIR